jgi:hypothetical protein
VAEAIDHAKAREDPVAGDEVVEEDGKVAHGRSAWFANAGRYHDTRAAVTGSVTIRNAVAAALDAESSGR